jgi:hypothetical protein
MASLLALCRLAGAVLRKARQRLQSSFSFVPLCLQLARTARGRNCVSQVWIAFLRLIAFSFVFFLYGITIEGGIGAALTTSAFLAMLYFGLPLFATRKGTTNNTGAGCTCSKFNSWASFAWNTMGHL